MRAERVVIYCRHRKEWYRALNKGLTPDRAEAHPYTRKEAMRLIDGESGFELQPAFPAQGVVDHQ